MEFNPTDEISSSEVQKIIRAIICEGTVIFTHHAKERMMERGYSTHDVEFILKHGRIVKKEFKNKTQTWSYKIAGQDLEGDEGTVITTIIKRMSAIIITVLG
jgi:hypothetical protein